MNSNRIYGRNYDAWNVDSSCWLLLIVVNGNEALGSSINHVSTAKPLWHNAYKLLINKAKQRLLLIEGKYGTENGSLMMQIIWWSLWLEHFSHYLLIKFRLLSQRLNVAVYERFWNFNHIATDVELLDNLHGFTYSHQSLAQVVHVLPRAYTVESPLFGVSCQFLPYFRGMQLLLDANLPVYTWLQKDSHYARQQISSFYVLLDYWLLCSEGNVDVFSMLSIQHEIINQWVGPTSRTQTARGTAFKTTPLSFLTSAVLTW